MAIAYPRTMPAFGIGSQRFELQRVDYLSPRTDGRLAAATAGWPLWAASWSLTSMTEAQTLEWRAWVSSLRGPQRHFYAADQLASLPFAYRQTGLGNFGGAASSWSLNTDRDVLTLTGMPSDFALTAGDYTGFKWGSTKRTMVRVLESVVGANPSFAIEPSLPTIVSGAAVAHVNEPCCLMRLTAETEIGDIGVDRMLTGRIAAIQDLVA